MNEKQSLRVDDVIEVLQELGGEANWEDIKNLVTVKRGGGHSPYANWRSYNTTMSQLVQQHCKGYAKFKGIVRFQKIEPRRFRLVGYSNEETQTEPVSKQVKEQSYQNQIRQKQTLAPKAYDIHEPPPRIEYTTYRVLRDTKIARDVKELYDFCCQICGRSGLKLKDGKLYAEVHHIKPLGKPHFGLDVYENVLCVCPNCHVLVDYGAIRLDISKFKILPGHEIEQKYVNYHNAEIVGDEEYAG